LAGIDPDVLCRPRLKKGQRRAILYLEAPEARFCPSIVRAYDSNWALTGITETSGSGPSASTTNWNFVPYPIPISTTEHQTNGGPPTSSGTTATASQATP